jgi:hypothetical protein
MDYYINMSLKSDTFHYYEQYSSAYIINLEMLNKKVDDKDVEQWINDHCYYILTSHLMDDFPVKLQHNLQLAQSHQDHEYIKYISQKLKINISPDWEYRPNKLKLILKTTAVPEGGCVVTHELSEIVGLPKGKLFKSRGELIHLIHKYIYDNQLQNRYDYKVITPDNKLQVCLTPLATDEREYTYVNLPRHLKTSILIE